MPLPQILPCPCLGVVLFKDILYVVSFACSFLNGEKKILINFQNRNPQMGGFLFFSVFLLFF